MIGYRPPESGEPGKQCKIRVKLDIQNTNRTMGSNRSSRLKEGTLEEEEDGAGSCFPKDGMKYLRLFYGLLMGFRLESIVNNQYTYEWS